MSEQVLIMTLAGRTIALPTADVHSVVELDAVHPVPRAPAHVLGLTALRSSTLTVIDAAAALGLDDRPESTEGTRVAIVDSSGHRYALLVHDIDDVAKTLSEPTAVTVAMGEGWARVAQGLVETERGPALLIDLAALIAGPPALAA